jgi:hypothetical protein
MTLRERIETLTHIHRGALRCRNEEMPSYETLAALQGAIETLVRECIAEELERLCDEDDIQFETDKHILRARAAEIREGR